MKENFRAGNFIVTERMDYGMLFWCVYEETVSTYLIRGLFSVTTIYGREDAIAFAQLKNAQQEQAKGQPVSPVAEASVVEFDKNDPQSYRSDGSKRRSVLQSWVEYLPHRHQAVLLSAIRGCDISHKDDHSKALSRYIRRAALIPADPRECSFKRGFLGYDSVEMPKAIKEFLYSLDQYPLHYVMHLFHAVQVIAYHHSIDAIKIHCEDIYFAMCDKMHVKPEDRKDMDERLTNDRIAAGTVEE